MFRVLQKQHLIKTASKELLTCFSYNHVAVCPTSPPVTQPPVTEAPTTAAPTQPPVTQGPTQVPPTGTRPPSNNFAVGKAKVPRVLVGPLKFVQFCHWIYCRFNTFYVYQGIVVNFPFGIDINRDIVLSSAPVAISNLTLNSLHTVLVCLCKR